MEHSERDRVVGEFRDGITKILIATDVLSRGFDVSQARSRSSVKNQRFRIEIEASAQWDPRGSVQDCLGQLAWGVRCEG